MHLRIHIHGLFFDVPCGEGNQTFKWLGLVAAQRYTLMAPQGRCRTREDVHTKVGFYLPAHVSKSDEIMHPENVLKEHCQTNDELDVVLQHEIKVDETGTPQFSPWATAAFCHSEEVRKRLQAIPVAEQSMIELEQTKDETNQMEEAIASQVKYTRLQAAITGRLKNPEELDAAVNYDWDLVQKEKIIDDPLEQEYIRDVLYDEFVVFNSIFQHYKATSRNENQYRMSYLEFEHFVHETGVLHRHRDRNLIEKIYLATQVDEIPSTLRCLRRSQFIEACIRVAVVWNKMMGDDDDMKLSEVFSKIITDNIRPTMERLTSGPLRDITHNEVILALYQQYREKLTKVYAASSDSEKDYVSISVKNVKILLKDSGILCSIDSENREDFLSSILAKVYKGISESEHPNDEEMVFVEFVEVIVRTALRCTEDAELSEKEIISIAFDAIVAAAKHSSACKRK